MARVAEAGIRVRRVPIQAPKALVRAPATRVRRGVPKVMTPAHVVAVKAGRDRVAKVRGVVVLKGPVVPMVLLPAVRALDHSRRPLCRKP